jgi:hypothetical protein
MVKTVLPLLVLPAGEEEHAAAMSATHDASAISESLVLGIFILGASALVVRYAMCLIVGLSEERQVWLELGCHLRGSAQRQRSFRSSPVRVDRWR